MECFYSFYIIKRMDDILYDTVYTCNILNYFVLFIKLKKKRDEMPIFYLRGHIELYSHKL